ncbi:MAG: hypothetical protein AB1846_05475 [Chloroflexota bacterium]
MNKKLIVFISAILVAALACSFGGSTDIGGADVLFQDDFSSTGSGWDRDDWENGLTDYANDAYRIYVKQPQYDIWALVDKSLPGDVKIEVDATKTSGPDVNLFGVICRYTENSDAETFDFYYLVVGSDGYAAIILIDDGQSDLLTETYTTDIVNPSSPNRISAVCNGSSLALSVNGQQVLSAEDSTLTSGDVGLVAGTFDEANVDVSFDNFVVTRP